MSRKTLVSDAISSLEAKLTTLCMREQEARNILEFISEQRRSLEREYAALQAQLNPFNWLPTELLIAIFVSFVQTKEAPECENTDQLASYSRPITLSHVCQRWRTVALSTSSLWTSVIFTGTNSRAVAMFLDRSKNHPVDIASSVSSTFSSEVEFSINRHLDTSSSRWRSVMCPACPPQILRTILTILNSRSSFPYLEVLHLNQKESVIHIKDNVMLASITASRMSFPVLKAIHLGHVSPGDIPPSPLPSVSELELNFTSNANRHLRMSDLCAMISRTPNLTELSMHGAVPLMDIYIRMSTEGNATPGVMLPHATRRTPSQISPLILPYLHRLEWSFAPPKDLWLLFYFIKMPAVRQLDLCLNQGLVRWDQYFNNQTHPNFINPLLGEHHGLVRLASLEELNVECVDTEGLTAALKKVTTPILKKLSITYLPPGSKKPVLPQLPRHESMFREPRLPTLTGLTLSCFDLDLENTTTMLKYMPSLTHLTFRSCLGAGKVICALSGGTCKNSHSNLTKSWTCPRLEYLVLTNCVDVKFRCLSGMIRTRRLGSLDCGRRVTPPDSFPSTGVSGPIHGPIFGRPMKPLKKRSPPLSTGSTSSVSSTTLSAPLSMSASPNGSFVPGWNSHEILKPACIKFLHVESCPRVSEVEALSLEETEWGVSAVNWLF